MNTQKDYQNSIVKNKQPTHGKAMKSDLTQKAIQKGKMGRGEVINISHQGM